MIAARGYHAYLAGFDVALHISEHHTLAAAVTPVRPTATELLVLDDVASIVGQLTIPRDKMYKDVVLRHIGKEILVRITYGQTIFRSGQFCVRWK